MHQCIATLEGRTDGFRIRKIAEMPLARQAVQMSEVAGLANQQPEGCALSGEFASHMVAYEAGGACEEYFHG
jgi:hypothetical protein